MLHGVVVCQRCIIMSSYVVPMVFGHVGMLAWLLVPFIEWTAQHWHNTTEHNTNNTKHHNPNSITTPCSHLPKLDPADSSLHWPALFLYPEVMQQDSVEDFPEDVSFKDQLDAVGAEEGREWGS